MNKDQIISRYHKLLSMALKRNYKFAFRIGDEVIVMRNVENIRHTHSDRDWIIWDKTRQDLEGKKGIIIEMDYTPDESNPNECSGCEGYTVLFGKRKRVSLHRESLRKFRKTK